MGLRKNIFDQNLLIFHLGLYEMIFIYISEEIFPLNQYSMMRLMDTHIYMVIEMFME